MYIYAQYIVRSDYSALTRRYLPNIYYNLKIYRYEYMKQQLGHLVPT